MSMTEKLIIMALLSLIVTTVIYPFVLRYALRHQIVDNPDARKIHRQPIPVMGGVAVYAGILAGCLAMWFLIDRASIQWSLMAVTTMLVLGVWGCTQSCVAAPLRAVWHRGRLYAIHRLLRP